MSKFTIGDRVVMTEKGRELLKDRTKDRGVVVGRSRDASCVRILRDGMKNPEAWHEDFWDREVT